MLFRCFMSCNALLLYRCQRAHLRLTLLAERNNTQLRRVTRKKKREVAMGSKVSGKMAVAGRVVQVVRPHAPLIKFPNRKDIPRPSVQEVLKMVAASLPETPPVVQTSVPPSLAGRPSVTLSRLPGNPDTVTVVTDFPQRYRRRLLAIEEMEYIQRGGPE
ncbi:hypothetical protein SKAU_G00016370 [Synaphobranchus kaupii]|uniref:Mitochondrial ribosomal protein S36 n=1 Tax=Synaphobranchus kaupii TaxID=118154 RepID=A0A9Q1GC92_SYNKA|nr:hypothetical protein SKAU_G00016370 [Synaphobranchus kaupii]